MWKTPYTHMLTLTFLRVLSLKTATKFDFFLPKTSYIVYSEKACNTFNSADSVQNK